jgi:hypothetical protein
MYISSIFLTRPIWSNTTIYVSSPCYYRHPIMGKWPVGHKWFFMKLELVQVWLQNWFGGVSSIPVEDYFRATPFSKKNWLKKHMNAGGGTNTKAKSLDRHWLEFLYFQIWWLITLIYIIKMFISPCHFHQIKSNHLGAIRHVFSLDLSS